MKKWYLPNGKMVINLIGFVNLIMIYNWRKTMYGLRKINKDGKHYNFTWPLEVGAVVKCPDWNPEPQCGGGLHLLPEAVGDYALLVGYYWCVVEFDENQMVRIDNEKAKVPECKIVYLSVSSDGLKDFFDFDKFDSQSGFGWARVIGDREIMRDKITDSQYAYHWVCIIGDREIMRDRITDSQYAYHWVCIIGDREIMRDRITDSEHAYLWARYIGDREIMRDRITDSEHAYLWACDIGDREIMIDKITDSQNAYWWALNIGDRKIMRDKITDSRCAYLWALNIGDVEIMRDRIIDPYWLEKFNEQFGEKPCTD